jgi:phosphoribulokinase
MGEGNLAGKSFYLKGREFWRPEMDEVIKKARAAGVTVAEFLNRLRGR